MKRGMDCSSHLVGRGETPAITTYHVIGWTRPVGHIPARDIMSTIPRTCRELAMADYLDAIRQGCWSRVELVCSLGTTEVCDV